jgi:hypothetical protein
MNGRVKTPICFIARDRRSNVLTWCAFARESARAPHLGRFDHLEIDPFALTKL